MVFALIGSAVSESILKISGIAIGYSQCVEKTSRVVIQTGHLTLVDTVLTDSAFIVLDKMIPMKMLEVSGYVLCGQNTILLDEVKSSEPILRGKIEMGSKVTLYLDSVYVGSSSRKLMTALNSELDFKRYLADQRQKRLNMRTVLKKTK